MKKIIIPLLSFILLAGCSADDEYQLSDFVGNDTLSISYNGTAATVGELPGFVSVSTDGAHVTVESHTSKYLVIQLSGTTSNGSLLVYGNKKYGIDLNGVSITNPQGPAINNQCGKSLFVTMTSGTNNSLTDGSTYANAPVSPAGDSIQQKGTLFSEGQVYFRGSGTLHVNGNARNGIATDDYITFEDGTVNVNVAPTGSNGVKANDGVFIHGGTLNIGVTADGARGIKNDARTEISGGNTTIQTSGDCLIEIIGNVADTTSAACIKCDSLFTMTGGTLTMSSSGDGGKGINCAENVEVRGGVFKAVTTGSNSKGKPKAVKSGTGIIVSGGSFTARVSKSWACDNGTDSEEPSDHVTIQGTPASQYIGKKEVVITF